jgi:peptide/nickel transport system permease protein
MKRRGQIPGLEDRDYRRGKNGLNVTLPFWTRVRNTRRGTSDADAPIGLDEGGVLYRSETGSTDETQWVLIWRRFRKHRMAMVSLVVVALLYGIAIFAEFVAPMNPRAFDSRFPYAPPHIVRLMYSSSEGRVFRPHVLGYSVILDQARFIRIFEEDPANVIDIGFFVVAEPYKLMGLFPMQRRLFGAKNPENPVFLLGADRLGRDLLSRMIYGTRISMTVGLVGVAMSLVLGVTLGGISGYFGGAVDTFIQRLIEFLQSIPSIPLWLGLSAAIPPRVDPLVVYFYITIILSVLGWTGLGRVVRGKFMSLKTEDFVVAARLDGCSSFRIIRRHMVPSFASHIIATTTLAVPHMIIGETSLSFLGLGLRAPVISWGVLLQEAQNIRTVSTAPWLLLPGIMVAVAVLALNFLGDGLRDAADPYA